MDTFHSAVSPEITAGDRLGAHVPSKPTGPLDIPVESPGRSESRPLVHRAQSGRIADVNRIRPTWPPTLTHRAKELRERIGEAPGRSGPKRLLSPRCVAPLGEHRGFKLLYQTRLPLYTTCSSHDWLAAGQVHNVVEVVRGD
jgi:hypothetical protein